MLHHAILVRTDSVATLDLSLAAEVEFSDTYLSRFGIDDARALVLQAARRPVAAAEQLLVIRTDFITHEAQNALLKILEEPPSSTRFMFVVPHDHSLLPTLASRLSESVLEQVGSAQNDLFESFLSANINERLTSIEQATKKKDLAWQGAIKRGLIQYLKNPTRHPATMVSLEYVARTMLTRGASNKMLLEQAALTLPARPAA